MSRQYPDLCARIIANSALDPDTYYKGSHCWVWLGSSKPNYCGKRYPTMAVRVPGKPWPVPLPVHRAVLVLFKGLRMTSRHVAAHGCNNTLCVNPEHIRRDSQSGNIQQAHDEGRAYRHGRGEAARAAA